MGIWAYRHPQGASAFLMPVLDLMQTIPIFAYLVPILFMFGFGPVSALVATIIYATPPMVRVTILALKSVDPELVDFGRMAGTTPRQLMWRVLVPSASHSLMVGVNQVIMLTLNMVIIASMIGAGGLGVRRAGCAAVAWTSARGSRPGSRSSCWPLRSTG